MVIWLKKISYQGPLHWLHNSSGNVIALLSHVVCGSQFDALKEKN